MFTVLLLAFAVDVPQPVLPPLPEPVVFKAAACQCPKGGECQCGPGCDCYQPVKLNTATYDNSLGWSLQSHYCAPEVFLPAGVVWVNGVKATDENATLKDGDKVTVYIRHVGYRSWTHTGAAVSQTRVESGSQVAAAPAFVSCPGGVCPTNRPAARVVVYARKAPAPAAGSCANGQCGTQQRRGLFGRRR
jgi:hypothetical protein